MAGQDSGSASDENGVPRDSLGDLDETREEPIGGDAELDRSIQAWFEEKNHEQLPVTVTLYKYKNPLSGEDKEQCNQWKNEIPDTHTIGVKFGAGRYYMIVNIPPGKRQRKLTTSRKFALGPYYDELQRSERQKSFLAGPGAGGIQSPGLMRPVTVAAPVDASLALMERMIAMLTPILQAAMRPPSSPGVEIVQAYQGLNHILKEQALETQALLLDSTRKAAGLSLEYEADDDGVPQAPEKPSILESLVPYIADFAKLILGGGPGGAAAAGMVKAAPAFKQVLHNPQELKEIVAYLDKNYGLDKTNIMLKKLKVERPR